MEDEIQLSDAADAEHAPELAVAEPNPAPAEPAVAAELVAAEPNDAPGPGHNSVQELLDRGAFWGGQAGFGVTALSMLALEAIEACHDGAVRPEIAKQLAQSYANGLKNAGGTPGSIKTLASKFKKVMELGRLNDGIRIAKEALRVRSEMERPKSPFETLVEIARHCLTSRNCELADDEIKAVIAKPEPKAKSKVQAEQEAVMPEPEYKGWKLVAIQINELVAVKDRNGRRAANQIRRQLDAYLNDDFDDDNEADHSAESPPGICTAPATDLQEAAHTPPAVIVDEEEKPPGELNE